MSARSIGAGSGAYVRGVAGSVTPVEAPKAKPATRYPDPTTVTLTRRQVFVAIDALQLHQLHVADRPINLEEVSDLLSLFRGLLPPDER